MKNSPLSEAKPESIVELFQLDPLEMTREHRDKIVEVLRAQRERFQIEESQPKTKGRKKLTAAPPDLSLKDLGL